MLMKVNTKQVSAFCWTEGGGRLIDDAKSAMWEAHIKTARWIMSKALQDKGLRLTYRSNIAMLIYDDQMAGAKGAGGRSHYPPTNLATVEGCNSIAERLIDLIFSDKR